MRTIQPIQLQVNAYGSDFVLRVPGNGQDRVPNVLPNTKVGGKVSIMGMDLPLKDRAVSKTGERRSRARKHLTLPALYLWNP